MANIDPQWGDKVKWAVWEDKHDSPEIEYWEHGTVVGRHPYKTNLTIVLLRDVRGTSCESVFTHHLEIDV